MELPLPAHGSKKARPHGLLTYTLCQVLVTRKSSLNYRELVQRLF